VSGGYSYLHPFSYLHVPVDFGVRLVAGLFADVGVQVGFAGPSDHGTVWLPSASLGLSYRFQTSVFQPRLGVLFRAALDSGLGEEGAIGARLGWAGQVGFDVLPPDSPLLIGLDVQGGMLGRPLWLSASAGVGLRF